VEGHHVPSVVTYVSEEWDETTIDFCRIFFYSLFCRIYLLRFNSYYDLDDQSVFWIQIRNSSIPSIVPMLNCAHYNGTKSGNDLTACPLDGCMFSAGGLRGIAYDWIKENLGK
jgi:hypothetical protein